MSRGSEPTRAEMVRMIVGEIRQSTELGAALLRAMASRIGMTVSDVQVLDLLHAYGSMTAGQLADHTGLTTGSITTLLTRLEVANMIRRERDPEDGRRVIVQLVEEAEPLHVITDSFEHLSTAIADLTAPYDDAHLAFFIDVLAGSNARIHQEVLQLQTPPEQIKERDSAPMGEEITGRLQVFDGNKILVRAGSGITDMYQAHFDGPAPDVQVSGGEITLRYPRRLTGFAGRSRAAEISLNATIPWQISIQGGGEVITAELEGLDLRGLEVKAGGSIIRLRLPVPDGGVPIHLSGGGSVVTVHRPVGVAARVQLHGRASLVVLDKHTYAGMGNNAIFMSPDFTANGPYYSFEIASASSKITIEHT